MDFEIRALTGVAPAVFARMAPKSLAPHLQNLAPDGVIIAVAAYAGGAPAGLGVARLGDLAEVLSLFVLPQYWLRGLGTALLEAMEGAMAKRCSLRAFL